MTVYVDVLIVLNIYVTYFILRATAGFLRASFKLKRLISAAVFGGFSSLSALIDFGFFLGFLLKILLVGATVIIAFGFCTPRAFLLRTGLSLGISFMISGIILLVSEGIGSDFMTASVGYVYMDISAPALVAATTVSYGVICILRRILDNPCTDKSVTLIIENNGKKANISAYPDSGNNLVDFLSGKPVIVCKTAAIRAVAPENALDAMINPDADMHGIRIIPCSTVSGGGIITAFSAESVTAVTESGEKRLDVLIGTSNGALENESFDAVINPKILI